ncbi:hypothetical protein ES705_40271 [subsurface metagenome]
MDVSPTIQHPHGRIVSITGTDPAAGAEISETVPARRRWRILAVRFSLVTDDTAVTRQIGIIIDDGTNTLLKILILSLQGLSTTRNYTLANFPIAETRVNDDLFHSFPPLCLSTGCRLRTVTTALQAGDNYSAPQLLIEEWIDP